MTLVVELMKESKRARTKKMEDTIKQSFGRKRILRYHNLLIVHAKPKQSEMADDTEAVAIVVGKERCRTEACCASEK